MVTNSSLLDKQPMEAKRSPSASTQSRTNLIEMNFKDFDKEVKNYYLIRPNYWMVEFYSGAIEFYHKKGDTLIKKEVKKI